MPTSLEQKRRLRRRVQELHDQLANASAELSALGAGEVLPGAHLLLEVEGLHALLPVAAVSELLRMVRCQPLPGAPPQALGSFLLRGKPVLAIDLGVCLGRRSSPRLDSLLVVLASTPTVALRVDGVLSVVDSPVLVEGEPPGDHDAWAQAGLAGGLCRVDPHLVPLLNPSRLLREASAWIG